MEWIKHSSGKSRSQIVAELTKDAVSICDKNDHIWITVMNNRGTSLLCIAIGRDDQNWYHKLISEDLGPDVYDCPADMLDMSIPRNNEWRLKVREYHQKQAELKRNL